MNDKSESNCNRCPVCESYIFEFDYDICPVCDWENDPLQRGDYDYAGGANKKSVNEARKAFAKSNKTK